MSNKYSKRKYKINTYIIFLVTLSPIIMTYAGMYLADKHNIKPFDPSGSNQSDLAQKINFLVMMRWFQIPAIPMGILFQIANYQTYKRFNINN